jgi:hypothetical protein
MPKYASEAGLRLAPSNRTFPTARIVKKMIANAIMFVPGNLES